MPDAPRGVYLFKPFASWAPFVPLASCTPFVPLVVWPFIVISSPRVKREGGSPHACRKTTPSRFRLSRMQALQMRRVGARGILATTALLLLFHRAVALPQHEQEPAIFRVLVGCKFDNSALA